MYQITIKKSAAKELEAIAPKEAKKIVSEIRSLADNPRPSGCKKLKGKIEELWRIRIGNYRVLYSIEDMVKVVDIKRVGHRKDIYE
jgi:mRNA interferase RelE/StbE